MPRILVRSIDAPLKARLQRRATRNGRSMEAEAREILRDALREPGGKAVGFGTATAALFRDCGLDEPIAELRGIRMGVPDFES
jgi:plasmid stability protein